MFRGSCPVFAPFGKDASDLWTIERFNHPFVTRAFLPMRLSEVGLSPNLYVVENPNLCTHCGSRGEARDDADAGLGEDKETRERVVDRKGTP